MTYNDLPFALQLRVYGAAWCGDVTETSATVAEWPLLESRTVFDRHRRELDSERVNGQPVPDFWACQLHRALLGS